MPKQWLLLTAALCLATASQLASPTSGWACDVPVCTYAMQRWEPAAYTLTVFHREALSPAEKALLAPLEKATANFEVRSVEVTKAAKEDADSWRSLGSPTASWAVLSGPFTDDTTPLWKGALGDAATADLLDSPARREIVKRLGEGCPVVWVLVESGDAKADADALRSIETNVAAARGEKPEARAIVRVAAKDPREKLLLAMLARLPLDAKNARQPVVVPVFGRGRALAAMTGADLDRDTMLETDKFLHGNCSCEIKVMNPGIDLLLQADWQAIADKVAPDVLSPELAAAEGLGANSTDATASAPRATEAAKPTTTREVSPTNSSGEKSSSSETRAEAALPGGTNLASISAAGNRRQGLMWGTGVAALAVLASGIWAWRSRQAAS